MLTVDQLDKIIVTNKIESFLHMALNTIVSDLAQANRDLAGLISQLILKVEQINTADIDALKAQVAELQAKDSDNQAKIADFESRLNEANSTIGNAETELQGVKNEVLSTIEQVRPLVS